jgi:hypothetical protein
MRREEQRSKLSGLIVVTTEGMEMDLRNLHSEKLPLKI